MQSSLRYLSFFWGLNSLSSRISPPPPVLAVSFLSLCAPPFIIIPELPLWCLPFCLPSLASVLFWSRLISICFHFPSRASALFPFHNSLYLCQDQDIWALVKNGAISQSSVSTSPYLFDCPSSEVGEICIRSWLSLSHCLHFFLFT